MERVCRLREIASLKIKVAQVRISPQRKSRSLKECQKVKINLNLLIVLIRWLDRWIDLKSQIFQRGLRDHRIIEVSLRRLQQCKRELRSLLMMKLCQRVLTHSIPSLCRTRERHQCLSLPWKNHWRNRQLQSKPRRPLPKPQTHPARIKRLRPNQKSRLINLVSIWELLRTRFKKLPRSMKNWRSLTLRRTRLSRSCLRQEHRLVHHPKLTKSQKKLKRRLRVKELINQRFKNSQKCWRPWILTRVSTRRPRRLKREKRFTTKLRASPKSGSTLKICFSKVRSNSNHQAIL